MDIRIKRTRLHSGQSEIKKQAKRFNVLECGRRFGKSKLGMHILLSKCAKKPWGWFAPTYKILSPVWEEIKAKLSPLSESVSEQNHSIRLKTGGSVECWSLDTPDAGRSRRYAGMVIDEASLVRDLEQCWTESLRPTLTDYKGEAWFLGTPKGHNYFHRLFGKGESGEVGWASWRRGTVHNPHIDPAEVETARRDLPEAVFNQEYLGIPADNGGNPFGITSIRACIGPLSSKPPVVFGVDIAKSFDWTWVIGLDDSGCVCVSERWQSDLGQVRQRIIDICKGRPSAVDATGMGELLVEDLSRFNPAYEGFKFTSSSKQMIMEQLASVIQRREIRFPDGPLVHELESFTYEYSKGGVKYSAPDGMHDDGVCALALAVEMRRRRPAQLTESIVSQARLGGGWKGWM